MTHLLTIHPTHSEVSIYLPTTSFHSLTVTPSGRVTDVPLPWLIYERYSYSLQQPSLFYFIFSLSFSLSLYLLFNYPFFLSHFLIIVYLHHLLFYSLCIDFELFRERFPKKVRETISTDFKVTTVIFESHIHLYTSVTGDNFGS